MPDLPSTSGNSLFARNTDRPRLGSFSIPETRRRIQTNPAQFLPRGMRAEGGVQSPPQPFQVEYSHGTRSVPRGYTLVGSRKPVRTRGRESQARRAAQTH